MPQVDQAKILIKIPAGTSFKFHSWGDEHIVYNSGSGNTHLVDELTYLTLTCVKPNPCDPMMIYQDVANAANLDLDEDLKAHLMQIVSELKKNQLIELYSV